MNVQSNPEKFSTFNSDKKKIYILTEIYYLKRIRKKKSLSHMILHYVKTWNFLRLKSDKNRNKFYIQDYILAIIFLQNTKYSNFSNLKMQNILNILKVFLVQLFKRFSWDNSKDFLSLPTAIEDSLRFKIFVSSKALFSFADLAIVGETIK